MNKILIINTKYKKFGGEDANILDEIKLLKKNYTVNYLEFNNNSKLTFFDFLSFGICSNLKSNRLVKKRIKEFKPDLVYIHNTWFKANLGIFKVLEQTNLKVFHKLHNFRFQCSRSFLSKNHFQNNEVCPACNLNSNSTGLFNKYYENSYLKSLSLILYSKKYFKIIKKNKIKILTITKFQKKFLQNIGIAENKIFLYHNPIQIPKIDNKNKSNFFVYAGRIDSSKGIENLIYSWIECNLKGYKLKIIGEINKLEDIISNLNFSSYNIEFLGQLPNKEVLNLISKSKAVITATKMYEGQPRLLCEASSQNTLSIYPSFGGMDEFFPSGYKYAFEQNNYDDLKEKIFLIANHQDINSESKKVYNHINKILNNEKLLKDFKDIVDVE